MSVFISCEQGGHLVPPALVPRIRLPATSGVDTAAACLAERLAKLLGAPLVRNEFSPDLIDVRRSLHHRELLGASTRKWKGEDRQGLIDTLYEPYRLRIRKNDLKHAGKASLCDPLVDSNL